MNMGQRLDHIDSIEQKRSSSILISILIVIVILVVGFFIGKLLFNKVSHQYNKIGDTITCSKFDITVNSVQYKKRGTELDKFTSIADPEWIGITLTVKNNSNRTQKFTKSMVEVQNNKGEVLKTPAFDYNIWGITSLNYPELESKQFKTGYIHFMNTNDDNSNIKLIFKCSSTDAIVYDISE